MAGRGCWVVRGGDANELPDTFKTKGVVAIGWVEVGGLGPYADRETLRAAVEKAYPGHSQASVSTTLGQLAGFKFRMKVGDIVATPIRATREVMIGTVAGDYSYSPSTVVEYPNIRKVEWGPTVPRDSFSKPARNSIGSVLTVFSVAQHLAEFEALLAGRIAETAPATASAGDGTIEEPLADDAWTYDAIQGQVAERIADHLDSFNGYEFQSLVAGVLEAMGYHATSSPPGRDGGVDIVAYKDPLGVEAPRIQVQVKHRTGTAGGPDVRQLIGILRGQDRGLFVSTGGFTKDAQQEAVRSDKPLSLVTWDRFVELLLEHYDRLEPEHQAAVPLRRMWVLAVGRESR
jgi:restriction system protein